MSFFGIHKVGEGTEYSDKHIPIDIAYPKLLQWLVSRDLATSVWGTEAEVLQKRARALCAHLPDSMRNVVPPSEADLNYRVCESVWSKLQTSPDMDTSKTLFGYWVDPIMKQWDEVMCSYRHRNVYLAEAAARLIEIGKYEIPNHRRELNRAKQGIVDIDHKRRANEKASKVFRQRFEQECDRWSLLGQDIEAELKTMLRGRLPQHFQRFVEAVRHEDVREALRYYVAFRTFLAENTTWNSDCLGDSCIALSCAIEHGVAALRTEEAVGNVVEEPWFGDANTGGFMVAVEGEGEAIHEDVDEDEEGDAAWCIDVVEHDHQVEPSDGVWSIQVVDDEPPAPSTSTPPTAKVNVVLNQALDLCDATHRHAVLNDLHELLAFISSRAVGSEANTVSTRGLLSVNQSPSAPTLVQTTGLVKLRRMQAALETALAVLEEEHVAHMLHMHTWSPALEQHAASIVSLRLRSESLAASLAPLARRREELVAAVTNFQRKEAANRKETRQLRSLLAKAISRLYNDRRVHITGDLFPQ